MSNFSERGGRRQRGNVLLESLIGVAITAIIGAGTATIAARISVGQHEFRAKSITVSQVRQVLLTSGDSVCGSTGHAIRMPTADAHVTASASIAIACAAAPSFTVQPAVNDPAAPASLAVTGLRPVTARVRLSALGIKAGDADAAIVVGTLQ